MDYRGNLADAFRRDRVLRWHMDEIERELMRIDAELGVEKGTAPGGNKSGADHNNNERKTNLERNDPNKGKIKHHGK